MFTRLEADDGAKIFQLLNTVTMLVGYHGSWKRRHEKDTSRNLHTFEESLKSAGFKSNIGDLLEQRGVIIEYTVNTLNPSRTSNLVQTFQFLDKEELAPSLS